MNVTYDPNVDYKKLMEQALARGDLTQAAVYEEKRNAKISGQGLSQYSPTKDYAKYLPQSTQSQMEEVLAKLENREPFSYDVSADKLYEQYAKRYRKVAQEAMKEANSQAALLTGGYSNSYGMTLGQEAYAQVMEGLGDRASELIEGAREDYEAQGKALENQYERLSKELDHRREAAEKLEQQEAKAKEQAQKQAKEAKEQAYDLALSMLKGGIYPSEALLAGSGISEKDAQSMYEAYRKDATGTSSAGASSGKGSSSSGSKGSSSSGKNAGEKEAVGKTLSNTLWSQLQKAYESGIKEGDLSAFHRNRSSLKAQGYSLTAFDDWARTAYGLSYESGEPKTVDRENVLSLGYGPLSDARLRELVQAGVLEQYTYGDYIRYRKKGKNYNANPALRYDIPSV